MSRLGKLFRRISEQELDDELRFHLEEATARNIARGMTAAEARRRALVALGGMDQTKEDYRDQRAWRLLEDFAHDLRYALRGLRRSPVVTGVAVLSLALGIGANTAIFSLLDAALLQTLPVSHPEQLVTLRVETQNGGWISNVPAELFDEVRRSPQAFSGVFALWRQTVNVQCETGTYRTLWQENRASGVTLHVRTRGNPAPLIARIREEIRTLNANLPVYDVRTLERAGRSQLAARPHDGRAVGVLRPVGAAADLRRSLWRDRLRGRAAHERSGCAHRARRASILWPPCVASDRAGSPQIPQIPWHGEPQPREWAKAFYH